MNIEGQAVLMGALMGGAGGSLQALALIFGGFKSLGGVPKSDSSKSKSDRRAFFLMRILYGAGLGFIITFWFMDDFKAGTLSTSKLAFVQFTVGYGSSILNVVKSIFIRSK